MNRYISLLHYKSVCMAGKMPSEPHGIANTYFWWERLAHSCLLQRRDSHQVASSLVGKNVLCEYGRSAQIACRMERIPAMFLPFMLCFLCCINLPYMRFHCQIGILAIKKNHRNSVYRHRCLYIWLGVNHAVTTGMNELSALTESIYTLKSRVFSLGSEHACAIYDHVTIGNSPAVHNGWDGQYIFWEVF